MVSAKIAFLFVIGIALGLIVGSYDSPWVLPAFIFTMVVLTVMMFSLYGYNIRNWDKQEKL